MRRRHEGGSMTPAEDRYLCGTKHHSQCSGNSLLPYLDKTSCQTLRRRIIRANSCKNISTPVSHHWLTGRDRMRIGRLRHRIVDARPDLAAYRPENKTRKRSTCTGRQHAARLLAGLRMGL
ncbi:hypothetical protein TNCV_1679181 [Trichonephila clavipes]|nr:hypothetical protein TNCV_1679181 [Trichonephila clavipes]